MRHVSKKGLPVEIQERDFSILRGLFESRIMTSAHIATLHFDGKPEAAKKRLQKLKAAGLLGERKRRPYEPSVLFLTRQALALLDAQGVLAEYPRLDSDSLDKRSRVGVLTIRHELEVMDVKAAFHSAIKRAPLFKIAEFTTWPLLSQFEASRPCLAVVSISPRPLSGLATRKNLEYPVADPPM